MSEKQTFDTLTEFLDIITGQVKKGIAKYGSTVDANPAGAVEWIDHAVKEKVDEIFYLLRLKQELKKKPKGLAEILGRKEATP